MESHFSDASLGEEEVKGLDTPVNIHVISYRAREHDTDGVSVKAVLDGLVKIGILPNDTSKCVKKVSFESIKSKEEKTIIEITTIT